jgi:hypothetical protein
VTLDQQISWVRSQVKHLRKNMPARVASGQFSQEMADWRIAAAAATLVTLYRVRQAEKEKSNV